MYILETFKNQYLKKGIQRDRPSKFCTVFHVYWNIYITWINSRRHFTKFSWHFIVLFLIIWFFRHLVSFYSRTSAPLVKVKSTHMKHKVWPRQPCWLSALLTQCPYGTVQTGTGKVDSTPKLKCTTAARDVICICTVM